MRTAVFGGLVAAAVFATCELAFRRAKKVGMDPRSVVDATLWAFAGGFVLSHITTLVLYRPDQFFENPMSLFMVWAGMSSFGGFIGGSLAAGVFLRRRGIPLISYMDVALFGFAPAWVLGRLGCTIAFDHPGRPTDFFLGMADASGVVRHNLGFYEMLWTLVITVVLFGLGKFRPFPGFHTVLVIFLYAPARFFFDTLRISDPLYFGWTPGQYFSAALFLLGAGILWRRAGKGHIER